MNISTIIIADMAKSGKETKKSAKASNKPEGPYLYIKEHMVARGLSDEDIAERIGVLPNAVWKRYTAQSRLTPFKIKQLADAIGIHPSELNYPPDVPSLDALADKVSPRRRAEMADIIKRLAQED